MGGREGEKELEREQGRGAREEARESHTHRSLVRSHATPCASRNEPPAATRDRPSTNTATASLGDAGD